MDCDVWFSPYKEAVRRCQRHLTPVHYHLKNHDILAAMSELRKGADPSVRDAVGRTALDLAIELCGRSLENALSTSIPVDYLEQTLEKEFLFPYQTPFVSHYDEHYARQNTQSDVLRYNEYRPDPSLKDSNKYYPTAIYDDSQSPSSPSSSILKSSDRAASSSTQDNSPQFPLPHSRPLEEGILPTEYQLLQRNVLIIVENSLSRPFPKKIEDRMSSISRRIKSYLFLIRNLCVCKPLQRMSQQTYDRMTSSIMYPYLYTGTLKLLFTMYPRSPSNEPWDPYSIADASRLVNIVVAKQLPGWKLLKFMAETTQQFASFLSIGTFNLSHTHQTSFNPSPELAQYLLHMAFVLNCPLLFDTIYKAQPHTFNAGDLFKWDELLYTLIQYQNKFPKIFPVLMKARLKLRIQKRTGQTVDEQQLDRPISMQQLEEPTLVPTEERYLDKKTLKNFSTSFGEEETAELRRLLREWKYGATRVKQSPLDKLYFYG